MTTKDDLSSSNSLIDYLSDFDPWETRDTSGETVPQIPRDTPFVRNRKVAILAVTLTTILLLFVISLSTYFGIHAGSSAMWSPCDRTCGSGIQYTDDRTLKRKCNEFQCPKPVNGAFSNWSLWTKCDRTCGFGMMIRARNCSNPTPKHGGNSCEGMFKEKKECSLRKCPTWGPWKAWEPCDAICGDGLKRRHRGCMFSMNHTLNCTGELSEMKECFNYTLCPKWAAWRSWTNCSNQCGLGTKNRSRVCDKNHISFDFDCRGNDKEMHACSDLRFCPWWSAWSQWSVCSNRCGLGKNNRSRTCHRHKEAAMILNCKGRDLETNKCNDSSLCPWWGAWNSWGECSNHCGVGSFNRSRVCHKHKGGGSLFNCHGENLEKNKCNDTSLCPRWGAWGAWGKCSSTCSNGNQTKERKCLSKAPCPGEKTQNKNCKLKECPRIDGEWRKWNPWTKCSKTCGFDMQKRLRICHYKSPDYKGNACQGLFINRRTCKLVPCPKNGNWSEWKAWTKCDKTCGNGTQIRFRLCNNPPPTFKGKTCTGERKTNRVCLVAHCPQDGSWKGWGAWSRCDKTCGSKGKRIRRRKCSMPKYNGKMCTGTLTENVLCKKQPPCPKPSVWNTWEAWGKCDASCDRGQRIRNRTCNSTLPIYNGKPCKGATVENGTCLVVHCPVDGHWKPWGNWSTCSNKCGQHTVKEKKRECTKVLYKGKPCVGNDTITEKCPFISCAAVWTHWGNWTKCDKSCDRGRKTRKRSCKVVEGGNPCEGEKIQEQNCNDNPCPMDGKWASWELWSSCAKTCGSASKKRVRGCTPPVGGGKTCVGNKTQTEQCELAPCSVPSVWSKWSRWSNCTASCGMGNQTRQRVCKNEPPEYDGSVCVGDSLQQQNCSTGKKCYTDGGWSAFGNWSVCDRTCDGGHRKRNRSCTNPVPKKGGKPCVGNSTETQVCNNVTCPVQLKWSKWGQWGECDRTCNRGHHIRYRNCTHPKTHVTLPPAKCGRSHDNRQKHICEFQGECPINGGWGKWRAWGACDKSCGVSKRKRVRICDNPMPSYGGVSCPTNKDFGAHQIETCPNISCVKEPILWGWSDWLSWSKCDTTCDKGRQMRQRYCYNETFCNKNMTYQPDYKSCNIMPCQFTKKSPLTTYFFVLDLQYFWRDAQKFCKLYFNGTGGLATIVNKSENDFIYQSLGASPPSIWLGATDKKSEHHWMWTHNDCNIDKFETSRTWREMEPSGSVQENCLEMQNERNGTWNDARCDDADGYYMKNFVCQNYDKKVTKINYKCPEDEDEGSRRKRSV